MKNFGFERNICIRSKYAKWNKKFLSQLPRFLTMWLYWACEPHHSNSPLQKRPKDLRFVYILMLKINMKIFKAKYAPFSFLELEFKTKRSSYFYQLLDPHKSYFLEVCLIPLSLKHLKKETKI